MSLLLEEAAVNNNPLVVDVVVLVFLFCWFVWVSLSVAVGEVASFCYSVLASCNQSFEDQIKHHHHRRRRRRSLYPFVHSTYPPSPSSPSHTNILCGLILVSLPSTTTYVNPPHSHTEFQQSTNNPYLPDSSLLHPLPLSTHPNDSSASSSAVHHSQIIKLHSPEGTKGPLLASIQPVCALYHSICTLNRGYNVKLASRTFFHHHHHRTTSYHHIWTPFSVSWLCTTSVPFH